ncbi:MAG: hypothetical protein RR851_13100 [Clostridium sp.]
MRVEIKKIKSEIWVDDYIIHFEYDTKRNNHKSQSRIITTTSEDLCKRDFYKWKMINNEDKPYRAMLNVKILSIEKCEGRYISL